MKLTRRLPKVDAIWEAMQGQKDRQRVYPADEAAIQAVTHILHERVERGKKLHTLTVAQVQALGFSFKTAKNAIRKLKEAGVISLVVKPKFDPARTSTLPGLYSIDARFIAELAPKNRDELWLIWYQAGGSFREYQAVLSQLQTESSRVTVEMLAQRLEDLAERTSKRLTTGAMFRKGVA